MNEPQPAPTTVRRRWIAVSIVLVTAVGVCAWYAWFRPEVRAQRWMSQAKSLRASHQWNRAEQSAAIALELNPSLWSAGLLAAECAGDQQQFQRAVSHLKKIATSEPRTRVRVGMMLVVLQRDRLHDLSATERSLRDILESAPDHIEANLSLARLLGLCGRMVEAIPYALKVIKLGVDTDLLVLLSSENGIVNDPEQLDLARRAFPEDPNVLMGSAWRAANLGQTDDALELLNRAVRLSPELAAGYVAIGQLLVEDRKFVELKDWLRAIPKACDSFGDTWFIRGALAEEQRDYRGAIRCYWEGLFRRPESRSANAHISRLLAETGDLQNAQRFADYLHKLQELENIQNRVMFGPAGLDAGPYVELARAYEATGRLWEACGWCRLAVQRNPTDRDGIRYLSELERKCDGLPLLLVTDASNVARSLDLSAYPLPQLDAIADSIREASGSNVRTISFRDSAKSTGFNFRYFNGVESTPGRRMYELTGGGIGAIDFDLDGVVDLFCTQGCAWPPGGSTDDRRDSLFRNFDGAGFRDVSVEAGILESGFGQGVAIGDYNSDGFPDIYVANIGANQLWLNNGDGTLTAVTTSAGVGGREWTTSCVIADLNADGLADLYDVNYVMGPDVFERVCRNGDGTDKMCMPFDFHGQPDRLWLNAGDGTFGDATSKSLSIEPNGMGLGVAVWDAHGEGRLSLLVANDTTANFFFVNESGGADFLMRDRGVESGLAFNGEGKATGCMGIAVGDVNDDGQMDLAITNFLGESSTLYIAGHVPGFFEDRTEAMRLRRPTSRVLGFGTQFLDANLDGRLELFMANGHIDDLTASGRPYRMHPLLFRSQAGTFAEVPASELGPYFQGLWLGRSAVRLDWNLDGRDDIAVGHLYDPYVLLTNTTPEPGRYLAVRVIAVNSHRDAIGTTLKVRAGARQLVCQLTAGDGYQASNERRVVFGLGDAANVDELEIHWPSGQVQRFQNIETSQEILVPEGRTWYTQSQH